ncbi:GntR family transcriptional regulator [Nocardioides insulae]|uniref:GntR family transcriptional regulator n=1 Tax=Nocardioides insulae TaxID=394734 RepID=UPI00040EABDC|nr:GntR family transcriptional regulator [Nocardioides insulae]
MPVDPPTLTQPPAPGRSAVSAAARAYEHTKLAILRGVLAPGAAISEGSICADLGVSRTPVHEAFLRLAAEGWLSLESRKGAVVRPLSPSEAEDVLQMREAVEASAAARAIADGRIADVLPALRELIERQVPTVGAKDVDTFVELDEAFHLGVVRASGNPIAVHFSEYIRDRQQRLRHQLIRVRTEQMGPALEHHRLLADALEAGDPAGYAATLHEHVALHRGAL